MSTTSGDLYVQFGAGPGTPPASWRSFDSSPTLRLQRIPLAGRFFVGGAFPYFGPTVEYGDIVKGLPVAEGSCAAIYCSHVLEHLALCELRTALTNTWRYLRPAGVFRLVLPDLRQLATDYLSDPSPDAAMAFMRNSMLGQPTRPRGLAAFLRSWLGGSQHRWMWDFESLKTELESAGFTDVRRASMGDSTESRFAELELPERWHGCLGIECTKPASPAGRSRP